MKTYVSFLRGINVGGNRVIKMEALRHLYAELGYSRIETYIQSGNVIFRGLDADTAETASKISTAIAEKFGFEVPVLVLEAGELRKIIECNPFAGDPDKDAGLLHVTFLQNQTGTDKLNNLPPGITGEDEFRCVDKAIYLYCPKGYGKTKLTNGFFENLLNCQATTRNWKTTLELNRIITGSAAN